MTGIADSVIAQAFGVILVGVAWGLTNPFMRKGAIKMKKKSSYLKDRDQRQHPGAGSSDKGLLFRILFLVKVLISTPSYFIPLALNQTGSLFFFILLRKADLSLAVPLANASAFLFTILGDWFIDRKALGISTVIGAAMVAGGIGLCVKSKL